MKALTTILLAPFLFSGSISAYWKGFNIGAQRPTGGCKTRDDWAKDFRTLHSLPGGFTAARVFASSDCGTLDNAVPAAIQTKTKILVGVWTENADHFNAEKQALLAAVRRYGHDWIVAVSVGSEDLYRKETSAATLAAQINDVRGMLWSVGAGSVQVGHVDTWTVWVRPENEAVIRACDFVGTDGYPYWQNAGIGGSYDVFWKSVNDVRSVVNRVKGGTWVWITETGWPVSGPARGPATPSVPNARTYWKSVACEAFRQGHVFWYALQDYTSSPSFGVLDAQSRPVYDLSC